MFEMEYKLTAKCTLHTDHYLLIVGFDSSIESHHFKVIILRFLNSRPL